MTSKKRRRVKARAKVRAKEKGQIKGRAKVNPRRQLTAVGVGTAVGNISAPIARKLEKEAMPHWAASLACVD